MNKLKWGVLGISGHYRLRIHLPLSLYEGAELEAIASRNAEKADRAAKEYGYKKSYGSYRALLEDKAVEAVYMPLPNHLHLEWIKKAADSGKHIICEKPLCLSSDEVEQAFAYCREKGVFLMEAFMFRFHPQWVRVKQIVDSGELGNIKSIQCMFSYNNTNPADIRNQSDSGGGALRDIGCYGIAVSNFLLGRDPAGVQSVVDYDSVFGTDQLTSFLLDFKGCHSMVTVSTQLHPVQRVRVTGTDGTLEVKVPFNVYNDVPAEIEVVGGVGERTVKTDITDQYRCEFENFTRAVHDGDRDFFRMMEDFSKRNQRVIDSVFTSGRK